MTKEDIENAVWAALDEIPDPHLSVSLVDMGMIYDVHNDNGVVTITMTYPCMGCPAYDFIQNDIESCAITLDGVESVEVEVTWEPVWSKERLNEAAREELHNSGIAI